MKRSKTLLRLRQDWRLYVILALPVTYIFLFSYLPMYGVQIAFRDYQPGLGFTGSPWVGFQWYRDFFNSFFWDRLLVNTFLLNVYGLLWGFPVPIILAIMLHHMNNRRYRKFIQTTIYSPNFISAVVVVGMLYLFLNPSHGVINRAIMAMGKDSVFFMNRADWFRTIYIASGIWQTAGYGTIIYFAALHSISPELYEAASVDGALRWHKIWYIDIPSLMPLAITFLIMRAGQLMWSETPRTLLMQEPGNLMTSNTLGPWIYRFGLTGQTGIGDLNPGQPMLSYGAAIGLMMNVINIILLVAVNTIAQKTGDGESSLW